MESIHAYIYSEEERNVLLQRLNLCPETSEMIRVRFERTTQEPTRVFTNVAIRNVLDVTNQHIAYRNIRYAKYTVRREDGRINAFRDADLINLCAYDLPHLHGYLSKRMENIKEFGAHLRKVVKEFDFKIALQLGVETIALTKPQDTHQGIERWIPNSVITRPLLGFVYMEYGVNKVFRIQEDVKYSNYTLRRIWRTIDQLKGTEYVHPEPATQIFQSIQARVGISKVNHPDACNSQR